MTSESDTAVSSGTSTLVVIDMQEIFRSPTSEWSVPAYDRTAEHVVRLADHFSHSVVWTKFVRDPDETGSWSAYYDRWSNSRAEPDSPVWDLTLPVRDGDRVLTLSTFSKWGPDLAEMTEHSDHIVVCGVATDCCVLATVLGAVDAGKQVTLVTDACGGATPEAHDQAVALMGMLAPMVTLAETTEIVK
ncbi:cysteine hydrolase [Agromyces neolithicus]|uniref:Isochorismatase family protein n=1 Tax=Agromyces neolithicus TaxID=269420 RepID=A0ABN2M1Y8_9MICO